MKDLTGLEVTVQSEVALKHYNEAVSVLCRFGDPLPDVMQMLEAEKTFVMGQVLNAYLALLSTDHDDLKGASESLANILRVGLGRLNRRERMHVVALEKWITGDLNKVSAILDELLVEFPTDILALLSGHQIDFFIGDAINLRDRVARAMSAWDPEHPLFGYLLGMLSFGQEEAGHYELAEQTAREAVARNPGDIWGIHAVAHALEMQCNYAEGIRYMSECESVWSADNGMVSHNAVHYNLFQLEANDLSGALSTYDRYISPDGVQPPMVLLDGSSVLWRLFLEGHDLGDRTTRLVDAWRSKADQRFYSFNDAHALMACAAAGKIDMASELVKSLREYVSRSDTTTSNHFMTQQVGLPICESILAFAKGDYATTIERLMSVKNKTHLFGGSLAQRDVFSRTLLESAIRSKRKSLARALISERLIQRPKSTYNHLKAEQVRGL